MIGSAPGEHRIGAAGVRLLSAWMSLKLTVTDETRHRSVIRPIETHGSIAHVTIEMKVRGKVVRVPYRLLLVYTTVNLNDDDTKRRPMLGVVHFSVATE